MHDVVIIGAGPSGLQAARLLGARGLHVIVIEEHETVGRPVHCTGILARKAFDEFDLPEHAILNALDTARFVSPAGQDVVYRPSRQEAVVVDRQMFDAQLAECAASAGAELLCGRRVLGFNFNPQFVSVDTSDGSAVRARACVLACGGRYALHSRLALGRPSILMHSAQAELPAEQPGDVELHFGSEAAPKGFAWAVPVTRGGRPYARVGVMCAADAPHYFGRMAERIRRSWGLDLAASPPPLQKILPLSAVRRTYGDRLLVVGDAAGLVKSTTGGGIYYSLLSATLAAGVLGDALALGDLRAESLAVYERLWRAQLDAELTTQLSLRLLAQRMSDGDIESLFELARTDGIMPIVRKTATFNRHRELILALFKHPPVRRILFRAAAS